MANVTTTGLGFFTMALCLYSSMQWLALATNFDIVAFGAKSGGRVDSTGALLDAWKAACSSVAGPSMIDVPMGRFLVGHSTFRGPCRNFVTFRMNGSFVAPTDYHSVGIRWMLFDDIDGISFVGGTVDGQGASLWSCKASRLSCPSGATSLVFRNSRNVMVRGLTSINSKLYHMVFNGCQGVEVRDVRIIAPRNSPNTDGIHIQMSSEVVVSGVSIQTGDDCISIGSGTVDLRIEQVRCGPGHGISIGSLGKKFDEAGVRNVTVIDTVFTSTRNGLRIKTWGRPSRAYVRGVLFQHAIMHNARNPIIIDQNYCEEDKKCPNQNSGVKISDVIYKDIRGTSTTRLAIDMDCSRSNPCTNITLQDVNLTYGNKPSKASCRRAAGTSVGVVIPPGCL